MNIFGRKLRLSIFGESHGAGLGIIVDGVPSGMPLSTSDFTADLSRRRPGAPGTTARREGDAVTILSGVYNGFSTGAPIALLFSNDNARPSDYDKFAEHPRQGHSDYSSREKFGNFADLRGGGHHSGRVTIGIVAAGVIAKKMLGQITISAKILEIGGKNPWDSALEEAGKRGDSLGGIIECRVTQVPAGLGEPFFDSVESQISHLIFSIPGVRGVEFGDGFASARMYGSQHNDPIADSSGRTSKNGAGGVNGGISNGNDIVFRVAVKPTSSIAAPQETYNFRTKKVENLVVSGRHDTCFALRVPVVIEAATAIALANF